MKFNSIGRTSNYAQAGKAAADDTVRAFAASRRNAPKYDEMAEDAVKMRSKEKIAAMKAEQEVALAGVRAKAEVKSHEIKNQAGMKRDKSKRKAGALAVAGKMFGTAGQYMGEKRTKRSVGSEDSWYDTQIKNTENSLTKYASLLNDDGTLKSDTSTSNSDSSSNTNTGGSTPGKGSTPSNTAGTAQPGATDGWKRLRGVIRYAEGTSGDTGYNTQFTGTQFTDMSQHPRQLRSSGSYTSDAAGAYQFLSTTWDRARNALNLPDFSPDSQEQAGRWLTQQRGVNPDQVFTNIDEFRGAMDKIALEWAGLPYSGKGKNGGGYGSSYYGQGGKSLEELWKIYNGG